MTPAILEERLIAFACDIIDVSNNMIAGKAGQYYGGQLLRSGSAPALLYGEAQMAESKKDFIHKVKIILKELKESQINLRIIDKKDLCIETSLARKALKECNELTSIFTSTANTAQKNLGS
jgi:four helix bundle protein